MLKKINYTNSKVNINKSVCNNNLETKTTTIVSTPQLKKQESNNKSQKEIYGSYKITDAGKFFNKGIFNLSMNKSWSLLEISSYIKKILDNFSNNSNDHNPKILCRVFFDFIKNKLLLSIFISL